MSLQAPVPCRTSEYVIWTSIAKDTLSITESSEDIDIHVFWGLFHLQDRRNISRASNSQLIFGQRRKNDQRDTETRPESACSLGLVCAQPHLEQRQLTRLLSVQRGGPISWFKWLSPAIWINAIRLGARRPAAVTSHKIVAGRFTILSVISATPQTTLVMIPDPFSECYDFQSAAIVLQS